MKIKYIVYSVLVIGIGALIYYRISANKDQGEGPKDKGGSKAPMAVNGIVTEDQSFANSLSLSGSVEANEQIDIQSEVSGIVEQINFQEGTPVTKGQVLFKVNDVELRAQAIQAATKQNLASENERRAKLLLEKEAISREEYDIASADFKTMKAQSQLINAQIAKTTVRAPFSGKIGLRSISPGTYVTPTTLIARLVNTSQVKITFSVPEKYAAQMKLDTKITFTVAGSKEKFTAKIYAIEPEVDVATRTLKMRAVADNPEGKLLPGTFANVELPLSMVLNAILIPTEAVVPVQDGKKVFIAKNGKAKEVKVETATRTDKEILITAGLKVGDTVLTTGVMGLKNDTPVKVNISAKK